ncbi:MAG: AbrB/MazE/SpoVT family DNA-binding domain-containing protein [Acidobacteriota bacterium]|nr:AbrB/MazE/SpoVT family DNA-binding domain-containing protein [Acidobacteriota bacterium]MDH3523322.1 AbrB/MazE/SpoVT family DNA-binding domain-containing protein [Acidobacteriota bacterium]
MTTATISSKYQVVIPKGIRQQVRIRRGQVVQVIAKGGVISLVPDRPLSELRGLMRGAAAGEVREKDRL